LNNVTKRIITCGLIALMILPILSQPTTAAGVGLGPNQLNITNALRGLEYEKTLTVFNPDENATTYTLRTEGVASSWITLYELDNSTTSINEISVGGKGNAYILVKIDVPSDVSNGTYNATIYAETVPEEVEDVEIGVGTILQASSLVTIDVVGTQIIAGEVDYLATSDTEVNYPLVIQVTFRNTGNVVVKPEISTTITKNGTPVDSFTYADTEVKPGTATSITTEWNTTGMETGDYIASVTVSLNGETLAEEDLPFTILPVGTLTRKAVLTELTYGGQSLAGPLLRISGVFENTGQIETRAKLVGELYVNGLLVDTFNSEELLVKVGERKLLQSYINIENPGEYTVKAHAVYEGKETETKELSFTIGEPETQAAAPTAFNPLWLLPLLVIVPIAVYLAMRRGKAAK